MLRIISKAHNIVKAQLTAHCIIWHLNIKMGRRTPGFFSTFKDLPCKTCLISCCCVNGCNTVTSNTAVFVSISVSAPLYGAPIMSFVSRRQATGWVRGCIRRKWSMLHWLIYKVSPNCTFVFNYPQPVTYSMIYGLRLCLKCGPPTNTVNWPVCKFGIWRISCI